MTGHTAERVDPDNAGQAVTAYHAKYFAHELTKRCASDNVEKLIGALSNIRATVDLNPHQIEAALFAFSSPLSKGAILADEVGLGKTIEAGLLLAQKWAEGQRKLLVIVPSNLRQQWSQEMADKFYLPSVILETRTFNEEIRKGNLNPFDQKNALVICSYQFAKKQEPYIKSTKWNLIVIDEAHRLRNVYKPTNKIANVLKQATAPFQKVLLTATPLQNSLLELYGLVSLVDEYTFGDLKSFKAQFARLTGDADFTDLKERLKPVCKRTLRKQVLQYIRYTERHALVQEFTPSEVEQRLYDLVTGYLQRPTLYALPSAQRTLMTLILRKLLASSTYAISDTLSGLAQKLDDIAAKSEKANELPENLGENFEEIGELQDEWGEDDDEDSDSEEKKQDKILTPEQIKELREEQKTLREFHELAKSIAKNSKGEVLLTALRRGFERAREAQEQHGVTMFQQKAIIFTESRRTQEYLFNILEKTEFGGKVVLFNGSNTDPKSQEIYQRWAERHKGTDRISGSPTADKRAALVEYFRDEAAIMIATEAAAEGINLQFCNMVVNYDLPWNPQRIEQRIGRCHRYGQKYDVVVVNFLNKSNAADLRVYQLLDEKFRLFDGVFGASDEVLGSIESGVDFEKRIATILQQCRSPEQISQEFDQLQKELEETIDDTRKDAREKLLNNFDQEVIEKVRIESANHLDRYEERLWKLTRFALNDYARFDTDEMFFVLERSPFPQETIHPGPYSLGKKAEDSNTYRVGHPLAQKLIAQCKAKPLETAHIVFRYTGTGKKISVLDNLVGKTGWLVCRQQTIQSFETEDHILLAAVTADGAELDIAQSRRLFDLDGEASPEKPVPSDVEKAIKGLLHKQLMDAIEVQTTRNSKWFEHEMHKLDKWAEDKRVGLKVSLAELDDQIKEVKKQVRLTGNLPDKLKLQREIQRLQQKRDEEWRQYDAAAKEILNETEKLMDTIEAQLLQKVESHDLMAISFEVK